jgi:hypothetical protein
MSISFHQRSIHIYSSTIDAVHISLPIGRVVKTARFSYATVTTVLSLGTTDGLSELEVEFLAFKGLQVWTAQEFGEARPE